MTQHGATASNPRRAAIRWAFLTIAFSLLASMAGAEKENGLSGAPAGLAEMERLAVARTPTIRAARHAWEAAQQRAPQVSAWENPRLGYTPDTGSLAETRAGPQGNGVSLSQAIPFPGKLGLKEWAAEAEAEAAGERYRATVEEVLRNVRVRYAEYFLAVRSLEVNDAVTELARQFTEVAEARYRVGEAAQQDVIQAREELSRLSADRVRFERGRESARGSLNALLDRSPRAPLGSPQPIETAPVEGSLEELLVEAEQNRPELRAEAHVVEARERRLSLAWMEYLPDFTVGGRYTAVEGGTNPMFPRDGHDIWMANLGISIPLWVSRIEAGVEEKRALLKERESALRDLRNRVHDEVQRAWEESRAARRTEAIYRTTLVPQTAERVRAARAAYETGRVGFLTLVDSLKSLERVRLERYRALSEYQRARAELERAVGSAGRIPRGEEGP